MSRPAEFAADMFVAAAGQGVYLLRQQAPGGGGGDDAFGRVVVNHAAGVGAVCWNRNNKVVASGAADGTIQLLYSNGQVMAVLPRDAATQANLGAVTGLSWSSGSKRLAAGTDRGSVYLFDMSQNAGRAPPAELPGHLGGVTAVEFQHEDKFLAVASGGGSVTLYSDPQRTGAAGAVPLHPSADTSARLSLSIASLGDPSLAAGSASGSVTVWDVPSQRVREHYADQHSGAVAALSFVPLRPGMLYSAGTDGRVCLQDRKAGPGHVSAFSLGVPATALMVKEDHSLMGVGTADGVVLLYDPRHVRQPLHTLPLEARAPLAADALQLHPLSPARYRPAGDAADGRRTSLSAPNSRAISPAADAAASAAAQQRSASSQAAASQAHAAAATPRASTAAGSLQVTPLHRPPAAATAQAAAGGLAVTPLPGMEAQRGAAAAVEVTPLQQQPLRGTDAAADVAQRLQRLGVTPLGGSTPAAAAGQQRQQAEQQQPGALTPLERLAAAPVDLNITPLVAPPAGRQAGAAAAAASARRPAPPPLDVTPLAGGAAAADRRSQLCISPLPGMAPEAQPAGSVSPQGRSILAERTNSGRASPGAVPLTSGRRGMLPRLASPLPVAPEAEQPQLNGSPSFAENQPLPSPAVGRQAQYGGSTAAEGKLKAASAAGAEAQVALTPVGSGALWTIPSAPADAEMADAAPSGARSAEELVSHPLEFSFAAAQRSLEQLSNGAAWGGAASCAPVAAVAEAAAGLPPGLRDDILALHWDMLQQFQAQQACMGQLVSQVLERNEALSAEVSALRKQLAQLTGRREQFLWL
ncbi:transducin family [Chlorella sorokiniana]|uniref:Transducin family n=1 Tax=Chlorella sorokiniana TaxID=3076 RepID=A0A2P6TIF6_CHLSO|nr:transducin family [Chlorella sorokiniana]|eukprot:PRW34049.1 transducin family [Chlorella sorokiniana]